VNYAMRCFCLCLLLLTFSKPGLAAGNASSATINALSGDPGLHSAAALVMDSSGKIVYGKDVDSVRSIASITKVMTAMVVLDASLDLDEKITVTKADRDLIQLTGSRLEYGANLSRRQMLQLALMSSENRAASALGRTSYAGGMEEFVQAMNRKAASLGMNKSHFSDPAGLSPDNVSTAQDLGLMILAADKYSLIRDATTSTKLEVHPYPRRGALRYGNTNRLLKNENWDIELSKTGYLNESGRCLVMRANIDGETHSIVLLNSFGKLTPFGDSNRMRKWLLRNS
jgi:D-alanyl-D-alanine endopeptidase (penicillin-binding protein 7)